MAKYELSKDDFDDLDEVLELGAMPVDASSNSLVFAHRIRALRERFRNAETGYLEMPE